MRIAQIAPLHESVPPRSYGGTERVVSYLTEELVRAGHEVTLFASGDSVTAAELVPICPRALRIYAGDEDPIVPHVLLVERVFREAGRFDVIHSHIDCLPFSMIRRHPEVPVITTLHGRLDFRSLGPLFREFTEIPVVSISRAQRAPLPWANWRGTVHHGLPPDLYSFRKEPGSYLAFLGRISREKRVDTAIEIACRAGVPLKIAAKIDRGDRDYFKSTIEALLSHPLVTYLGEIGDAEKQDLLGGALALLFPVDWPEPFGLVMIEAMACGTPVIAMRRGSVPEVICEGESGFIVDGVDAGVKAVHQARELGRARVRRHFEERFTAARMARDYLRIYRDLAGERDDEDRWGKRTFYDADQPAE